MLFLKPIANLEFEDVEKFCKAFTENIRVEYKSVFDQSVKNKLSRVISAFANSYGGVLIIGVNAKNGIPESPIDGITFEDPEPRLTVENICRSNIFPEVTTYSKLVQSSVPGKAFLVIQINESPKAPHAIENSTHVYVRTGDSIDRTKLADLNLIERLLQRRREVLARWNEFYKDSTDLAGALGVRRESPHLELKVGPLYPTDTVISRENVLTFMSNRQMQYSLGFRSGAALRHPVGAILANEGKGPKYLNTGELATLHYIEPLQQAFFQTPTNPIEEQFFRFWSITAPMLRVLDVAANLFKSCGVTCDVRIEAVLRNISKLPFTLSFNSYALDTLPVNTVSASVTAAFIHPSESLGQEIKQVATELLYQLRWPFGTENPHTRREIAAIVARALPMVEGDYSERHIVDIGG